MLRSAATQIKENDVLKAYSSRKYKGNKYPTFNEVYELIAKRHNLNMAAPAEARRFEYSTKLRLIIISKKFDLEYSVPIGSDTPTEAVKDLVITLFFELGMGYSSATRYLNLSQHAFDKITNTETHLRASKRKPVSTQTEEELEYTDKKGDIDAYKFFKVQVRKSEERIRDLDAK